METTNVLETPATGLPTVAVSGESSGDRTAQRQRLFKPRTQSWGEHAGEVLARVDADLRLLLPNDRHAALVVRAKERMEAANAAALKEQFRAAAESAWDTRMEILDEVFLIEMTEASEAISPFCGRATDFSEQIAQAAERVSALLCDACIEAHSGRLKAVRLVRQAADIASYVRSSPMGRAFLHGADMAPTRTQYRGGGSRSKASARGRKSAEPSKPSSGKDAGSGKREKRGR